MVHFEKITLDCDLAQETYTGVTLRGFLDDTKILLDWFGNSRGEPLARLRSVFHATKDAFCGGQACLVDAHGRWNV